MFSIVLLLSVIGLCWYTPVTCHSLPDSDLWEHGNDGDSEEVTRRFLISLLRGLGLRREYTKQQWSKRVPPYITGGIRY
ncbi:unnamed protein product [Heterobilharzia americana]|nr:unnamed protein product [Heterobilharzia americana]CAH8631013.1 unnamed protein product [Heterobilharzia americana]